MTAASIYNGETITVTLFGGTQATGQVYNLTERGMVLADHDRKVKYPIAFADVVGWCHAEEAK